MIKFIYSEKATKFCEISTNYLSYVLSVKNKVEISQNFVAFSEYMNLISELYEECELRKDFTPLSVSSMMQWLNDFFRSFISGQRPTLQSPAYFSNFSCRFLNPNTFFPIWILIVLNIRYGKPPGTSWKSILLPEIVLTFHCLNKLF